MAVKNTAQVVIGGKIITLGGYESEEYFQKVASYINNKIAELSEMPGYTRQPVETKHTLLSLNVTDDYFKAKKQAEIFEQDLQQKDQLERFNDRQNNPEKRWKITDEDWRNREKWDQYEEAVDEMLKKTSTTFAPWHILESVDKKYARIKALKIVIEEIEKALK